MRDGYVPQGLGTRAGWGGTGNDLFVQSACIDATNRAVVVGMVPGGGSTRTALLVRPGRNGYVDAHVGGSPLQARAEIKVDVGWARSTRTAATGRTGCASVRRAACPASGTRAPDGRCTHLHRAPLRALQGMT